MADQKLCGQDYEVSCDLPRGHKGQCRMVWFERQILRDQILPIPCEKGLCREPARWLVDLGGTMLAERCDEHRPDQSQHKSWPLPKGWVWLPEGDE